MKNLKIKWVNLMYNIVVALLITAIFSVPAVITVSAAVGVGIVLGFVKSPSLALFMAIQKEIWENHIEEAVFDDNGWLNHTTDAGDYVIGGRIVHIPQSGGAGNVVKNRTVKPAAIRERVDTEVLYKIDEYTTDPVTIPNADTHELSYDKRESVLGEDRANLSNEVAEGMLLNFISSPTDSKNLPVEHILLTAGGAVPASAPDATGNRKAYSVTDLQRMQAFMRKQKMWKEGQMYCLLTAEAAVQIFPADSVVTATYMAAVSEEERRLGIMYKCQGWNIMVRSSVYLLDGAGAFKPVSAEGAATDDEGCLFWNKAALERAKGEVKAFEQTDAPTMYGDVYSFLIRVGGRARREGYKGVAVLKQDKAV